MSPLTDNPVRLADAIWYGAFILVLTGCGGGTRTEISDEDEWVKTTATRGPIVVEVAVGPKPVRFSDEPTLRIRIACEQGIRVQEPPFGEALGDFGILDYRSRPFEISDGKEVKTIEYTLEPLRTGELVVAPITVRFTDDRASGDGLSHDIETEPLTVTVQSLLDDRAPSLGDLQGLSSPIAIEAPRRHSWLWVVVLVGGGGALLGVLLWWRRRPGSLEAQLLSPRELAYLDLNRLIEDGLAEIDVKQFYVELTSVVRVFIERTTRLNAPDQTTEEFLREIGQSEHFTSDDRLRLGAFLESADLVKFAAVEPSPEEIEESFERAKRFLGLQEDLPQEVAA